MERKSRKPLIIIIFACALILCTVVFFKYSMAPISFPINTSITLEKGVNISDFSNLLKEKKYIGSANLFKLWLYIFGQNKIISGSYYFNSKESSFALAKRFSLGSYGIEPVKVVIPEGSTVNDIAWLFMKKTKDFEAPLFVAKAHKLEGYLFPDTYTVMPFITYDEVIKILQDEFKEKIEQMKKEVNSEQAGKLTNNLNDIIVMASILEKEANDAESRRIISGILWKRMANGWPLQVDASLGYITGKTSAELTLNDLKIDSPYNTYKYKGLPKSAIANPGYDAILAALKPTDSSYWFYLSDNDGKMHYAKTLQEHVVNKAKYLK